MTIIAINLTLIEFIVLPLVAIIFGFTLHFFIKSRKSLQEALQKTKKAVRPVIRQEPPVTGPRASFPNLSGNGATWPT